MFLSQAHYMQISDDLPLADNERGMSRKIGDINLVQAILCLKPRRSHGGKSSGSFQREKFGSTLRMKATEEPTSDGDELSLCEEEEDSTGPTSEWSLGVSADLHVCRSLASFEIINLWFGISWNVFNQGLCWEVADEQKLSV